MESFESINPSFDPAELETALSEQPTTISGIEAQIAKLEPALFAAQEKLVALHEKEKIENKAQSPAELALRSDIKSLDYQIQKLKGDRDHLLQEETDFIKKSDIQ